MSMCVCVLVFILPCTNKTCIWLYFRCVSDIYKKRVATPPLGVAHIAKFCLNIAFWRCHTHFSHIAASQYAKWQHQLIQQMMALQADTVLSDAAATRLPPGCRITQHYICLQTQWFSSQPWLDPHSLVCTALQVQSVKDGIWTMK